MTKRHSVQEREYERARAEMVDRLRKLIRHYSASRVSIPTNIADDARAYGVSLKGTIYNNAPKDSGDIIVIDYDSSSKWDRFTENGENETKGELEQLNYLLFSKNLFQRDFIYAFFDQNHAHEILFRGVYRGASIISALTLEKTGLGFPVDVESSLVDLLNQAYKDEIKPMVVVYDKSYFDEKECGLYKFLDIKNKKRALRGLIRINFIRERESENEGGARVYKRGSMDKVERVPGKKRGKVNKKI